MSSNDNHPLTNGTYDWGDGWVEEVELSPEDDPDNYPDYNRVYPEDERELEGYAKRARKYGSDFLDHDHSMNG